MATRTTKKAGGSRAEKAIEHDDPTAVRDLLAALDHPAKPFVEAIRKAILGADDRITEGVKWNSPSFYCHGWFATINLRNASRLLVILHHGAKARPDSELRQSIEDPGRLLTWPSPDRAQVWFANAEDFQAKRSGFASIIRQWAVYQVRLSEG